MKQEPLESFIHQVLDAGAPRNGMYSLGLGGMSGGAASALGASGASSIVSDRLRGDVQRFAEAYQNKTASQENVVVLARVIEGSILSQQTLSVIDETTADALIDQLHDLISARSGDN
jgi:shikimate 5-dehydrogenase